MGIFDNFYNNIAERIANAIQNQMIGTENKYILDTRKYRMGLQPSQLKVRPGQFDDNLVMNFCGLVVNRAVSQVIGNGVEFDFEGETETPQETYIAAVLDANKQEILFHRAELSATEAGTGYIMIVPDGVIGKDGNVYPRLMLLDPILVKMYTLPEDHEIIIRYVIEYTFTGADGKEWSRRRTIEQQAPEVLEDGTQSGGNYWTDIIEEKSPKSSQYTVVSQTVWEYDFPPVIHWQNLPSIGSPYGESDIPADVLRLQDRINFSSSNLSKIVRLYAHAPRYGKMLGDEVSVKLGTDDLVSYNDPLAEIVQLQPVADLTGALSVFHSQRQALFDITRSVDIDSMQDKLGSLTNFGLKVLYQDTIAKINTKRELFGDMLEELIRRIQVLNGMEAVNCEAVWPEFLPINDVEKANSEIAKVGAGLKSKQTAATDLGEDWEREQERMIGEQAASSNIGAEILRAFENGQNNNANI